MSRQPYDEPLYPKPTFQDPHRKVMVVCRVRPPPSSETSSTSSTAIVTATTGVSSKTATTVLEKKKDPFSQPSSTLTPEHPFVVVTTNRQSATGRVIPETSKYAFDFVFGGIKGSRGRATGSALSSTTRLDNTNDDNADGVRPHDQQFAHPVDTNPFIYDALQMTPNFVDVAMGQGVSCAVAFGATGSGKTHTMTGSNGGVGSEAGLMPLAIDKLFARMMDAKKTNGWDFSVKFSAVEIAGRTVTDLLLTSTPATAACDVKEDDLGRAYVSNCLAVPIRSPEEAAKKLHESAARRRTSATFRNNTSSRTHAVFIFRIKNETLPLVDEGEMMFLDLAGSEAAYDKSGHDAATLKETALINGALANLKECLRARANISANGAHVHIPYRSDKLTLLLKALFEPASSTPSSTILFCCASPLPSDAVHSSHSLKYIAPMRAALANAGRVPYNPDDPSVWGCERVSEFLMKVSGGKINPKVFAECEQGMSGKQLITLTQQDFIRRCCALDHNHPRHNDRYANTSLRNLRGGGSKEAPTRTTISMEEAIHYFGELWEYGSAARDFRRSAIERNDVVRKVMSANSAEVEQQLLSSIEAEKAMYERYQKAKKSGDAVELAAVMALMTGAA